LAQLHELTYCFCSAFVEVEWSILVAAANQLKNSTAATKQQASILTGEPRTRLPARIRFAH
jgi:hypothetical protein